MTRRKKTEPAEEPIVSGGDLDEVELRFVTEFMIDRDAYAAAIRTGVAPINLKRRVQQWMTDSKIARAIQLRTDSADIDKMVSPQRIIAGFMDVAFDKNAPASARSSALRELVTFKKMYEEEGDSQRSGVIFVPVAGSASDWEKMAQASQSKLKEDVRG